MSVDEYIKNWHHQFLVLGPFMGTKTEAKKWPKINGQEKEYILVLRKKPQETKPIPEIWLSNSILKVYHV